MNRNECARACLRHLVRHVFNHRDGLICGLYYQELAESIGFLDKNGKPFPRLGKSLGKMGHLLRGLQQSRKWGEPIPEIQSLVVLKNGPGKGLPDDGMKEFWESYEKMSFEAKRDRVQLEYKRVVEFGSRWNDVLRELDLPEEIGQAQDKSFLGPYGLGGESEAHKALKDFVYRHPEIFGADSTWERFKEYPTPSLDVIDVLFKSGHACIAVEVKSGISDNFPLDYQRGLYQTVKYASLLRAMAKGGRDIPPVVTAVLAVEFNLPKLYKDGKGARYKILRKYPGNLRAGASGQVTRILLHAPSSRRMFSMPKPHVPAASHMSLSI